MLGLWALIGLGVGILIPNQVAALLIAVGVAWIVEPIIGAVLPLTEIGENIARYLPSQATNATLDVQNISFAGTVPDQLAWWAGALVLTGYAVVMALIGTIRTSAGRMQRLITDLLDLSKIETRRFGKNQRTTVLPRRALRTIRRPF